MARIAYSCCGEGRGHSSRTFTIARALRDRGHQVRLYASHAAYAALNPIIPDVTEIPGLVLKYRNNRVQPSDTVVANWKTWRSREPAVARLRSDILSFKPNLVITDFEPLLPEAAKRFNVPFISLDHQHVIPGLRLRPPLKYWPHYLATLGIVRWTHSGEIANLVTSFFKPNRPVSKQYHYFGPILRDAITKVSPSNEGHVLVYQTSSSFTNLPDVLREAPGEFRVYAFAREGREGNCVFKPRNHPDFLQDLASCSWVLTNGGYTLISEALALGKPVLSVPVEGQFEQWINSYHLHKLGYGVHCEREHFSRQAIRDFWEKVETYRTKMGPENSNATDAVLNKVLSFL